MKDNHIDYSDYYAEGGKVDKSIPLKIRKEIYDSEGERRIDERAIEVLTEYAENLPQTKDLNTNQVFLERFHYFWVKFLMKNENIKVKFKNEQRW